MSVAEELNDWGWRSGDRRAVVGGAASGFAVDLYLPKRGAVAGVAGFAEDTYELCFDSFSGFGAEVDGLYAPFGIGDGAEELVDLTVLADLDIVGVGVRVFPEEAEGGEPVAVLQIDGYPFVVTEAAGPTRGLVAVHGSGSVRAVVLGAGGSGGLMERQIDLGIDLDVNECSRFVVEAVEQDGGVAHLGCPENRLAGVGWQTELVDE